MASEKLYDLVGRKYLRWNFDTYSSSDRLIPVLRLVLLNHSAGEQQIKLEYYQGVSCKRDEFLASEYLDAGLSDEELLSIIDAHMRTDRWFEIPEYFAGEHRHSLPFPVGFVRAEGWIENVVQPLAVEPAGYEAAYQGPEGRSISTETVFDVCIPTDKIDAGIWYLFSLTCGREEEADWRGFDTYNGSEASLVLTATLGNWSFGISAYNSRSDPQLRDFYEVRYAPDGNGFLFRVRRKEIERIWFKAAWLKSKGMDADLCQQALRHWLE